MFFRTFLALILPLTFSSLLVDAPARAATFEFDFENQTPAALDAAQFTSLTINKGSLSATFTRPNNTAFSITDISPISSGGPCVVVCAPASWDERTLSPFVAEAVDDYFIVQFSQVVSAVSIEAGDRNVDSDVAKLELYDSAGTILDSTSQSQLGQASIPSDIISLNLSRTTNEVSSIRLYGGSSPDFNSLFWDNLTVTIIDQQTTSVPAPLPLLGAGIAFGYSRKIRRRIRNIS